MKKTDILQALHPVVQAFEQLGIPYYIGGSVASSLYGMARATMDIDIVADIKKGQAAKLKTILKDEYYIDEAMILEAITNTSSFNLIHFNTAFKIDVFVQQRAPYPQMAIERRVKDKFDEEHDFEYCFSTPEDCIIAKLQWFEKGNRVSERQWLDILGIIKVQADHLDLNYLAAWTKKLGMFTLLEMAFQEAGVKLMLE